jgi:hypothetical protein
VLNNWQISTMSEPALTIIERIPSCFDQALASGDLLLFPSTVKQVEELGTKVRS